MLRRGASPQDDIGYKTVVVVEGVRLSTDDQARQVRRRSLRKIAGDITFI